MDINEKKSGIFRWLVSISEYISVCILNVVSLIYGLADLLVHIGLGVIELRGLLGLGGGLHSTVCRYSHCSCWSPHHCPCSHVLCMSFVYVHMRIKKATLCSIKAS